MTEAEYKPFYLESVIEVNDQYYILEGYPPYEFDENYFYEIHIEAPAIHFNFQDYVDTFICADILSSRKLEIYYGSEYYSESFSDGEIEYKNYTFKKIKKASETEWKPKFQDLQRRYNKLLNEKLPAYVINKDKVENNYRFIYDNLVSSGKNYGIKDDSIDKPRVFISLYHLLSSLYTQYYLEELVSSPQTKVLRKDWNIDFLALETKFNNLLKVNVDDYAVVKSQFIEIYTDSFNHMLSNIKHNYKDIDESQYILLFADVIKKLKQT
ncbi:hypothetical protein [Rufibacter sp. LB8]|uniref:hypothetical protein n=1 Tax=Rufibacter sp. LB8 TaxID=2777781 RepID=UPI00178C34B2|nr:hypothetical protein [Rufibacter sp. LB8]